MTDATATHDTTTRQYGAAIALVSGLYALVTATLGGGMTGSASAAVMALLGVVVVAHGVALLTPYASRLGDASGPLMIVYALVMILNRALVRATGSANWGMGGTRGPMGPGMHGGMGTGAGGAAGVGMAGGGWNLGLVALAVLLLVSGVIMTARDGESGGV